MSEFGRRVLDHARYAQTRGLSSKTNSVALKLCWRPSVGMTRIRRLKSLDFEPSLEGDKLRFGRQTRRDGRWAK